MKKRLFTLLTAALVALAFVASGCSGSLAGYDYTGKSDREFQFKTFLGLPGKMPIYNANETSYYLKSLTDEEFDTYYREMAEAGFTVATAPSSPEGESHNLRMLDAAEKYGLHQLLGEMISADGISLTGLMQGRGFDPFGNEYGDETVYSEARIRELLGEFLEPYLDHPAFYGLAIWDEPSKIYYDRIESVRKIFEEVAPGKLLYVNLLPITADRDGMGLEAGQDVSVYAQEFIEKVDLPYISYDRYPIMDNGDGTTRINEDFLYNMQIYRQAADSDPDGSRELWTYLLATEHTFGTDTFAQPDNIADIRWQVYAFLAFGGDSITWFTYFPPEPIDQHGTSFGVGPYDRKGRKTDIYYYIKQVQQEVHAFEEVYFNFDWKSVITVMGEKNEDGFVDSYDWLDPGFAAEGHERISSLSCEQDTLIGCFEDAEGQDGFMVMNYAEPGALKESRTRIAFQDAYAAAVYRRGEKRIVKLGRGGTLNFTLLAGEGVFVVPLAKK